MQKFIKIIALFLCLACVFGLAACGGTEEQEQNELNIVCTLFPYYDFARQIAADKAEVTLLLTPGTDSHSYDPSPVDMVKIKECDLFIYTGDIMESWARNVIGGVETLDVSENIKLSAVHHGEHEVDTEEHSHSADPHIWTSPVNAVVIVEAIAARLAKIDHENEQTYSDNARKLTEKLNSLDAEIRQTVSAAKNKTIVMCDRFALHYFCEEYGLDYIAAFDSCTSETEPSPAVIVEITKAVQENKIPAVFCAELSNRKVALAVAKQTGAEVLELHSCHNLSAEDFSAGETYISLMERNLKNLKTALGA